MTGVLIKRGDLEADMTPGRMPCEHEGRDPCDSSTSQEMPKTASNHQKLGIGKGESSLDFRLQASRIMR